MSRLDSPNALLTIVTLCHAVNHMYAGALPILYPAILKDLGLSYTQLGLVIAAQSLTLGVLQFGSSLAGRYMSKRILLGVGNILLGVGNFIVGVSNGFLPFLLGRVVAGVGGSPQHPIGTSMIADRFKEKARGSALGAHFGLSFIGNIVGPVASVALFAYAGWRSTLYVLTVPAVVMGASAILLIRENASKSVEGSGAGLRVDIREALTDRRILMLLTAQLLVAGAGQGILMNYTPIILSDMFRLDEYQTALFFTALLVGGTVGPLVIGRLSDVFGCGRVGLFTILGTSIFLYLFINLNRPDVVLGVVLILLGVNAFSAPVVIQAALADVSSQSTREVVIGIYFTSAFTLSSVWVAAVGYFADIHQTFTPILTASLLFNTLAAVFVLLGARRPLARGVESL